MRFVFLYMHDFGKNNRTLFIAKLCIIIYNVYDRQFCIINIYILFLIIFRFNICCSFFINSTNSLISH